MEIIFISYICNHIIDDSLADPGGPPPQQDPILLFLHTLLLKSAHIEGRHPPNGSAPPQWEILDLPLISLLLQLLTAVKLPPSLYLKSQLSPFTIPLEEKLHWEHIVCVHWIPCCETGSQLALLFKALELLLCKTDYDFTTVFKALEILLLNF